MNWRRIFSRDGAFGIGLAIVLAASIGLIATKAFEVIRQAGTH